ncbi:hypothetical protein [Winogradskyella jejuensis]|uniref:Uncharacterized protein n=1 Tax=Winogradskyella jejuensis TaxID=1089305 RepID=A0A1M5RZ60_9FLAO|nr:hypothetical protein [Winogradskyella jejuensis]SHH31093.1 hypothetical protein SAMN05444148_1717 [Winogradskyella jejuensis]
MIKRILLLLFVCIGLSIYGQSQKQILPLAKYGDNLSHPLTAKERSFIDEVYGEYANKFVYENAHRLKAIKHILRNRVVIENVSSSKIEKEYTELSNVPLQTGFVSNLKRDKVFNPKTFNPLKFNFEFYGTNSVIYHVDDTNYYIVIKSQYL